ncbi:MAG: hypothetical protein KIT83_13360 [Bryobacterales bacterium]|nr:hypothetical protein [Bryobacterales bacterium]
MIDSLAVRKRPHASVTMGGLLRWTLSLLLLVALPVLMHAQAGLTVSPPNGTFSGVGGTLDFQVTVTAGTPWTAVSNESWLTVVAGSSGTGPGVVRLSADTNETNLSRTARLTVGSFIVYLVQDPLFAVVRFLPDAIAVPPSGVQRSITVIVEPPNLAWQATSSVDWITVITGRDVGSGQVNFVVAANPTAATRVGQITVVGQSLTVTQTGSLASFTVSPSAVSIPFSGGAGQVTVTAQPDDARWGAFSLSPWISVSGGQFTGSGVVSYTADSNPLGEVRQGNIRIADTLFVITQAANPDPVTPTDPTAPSTTFRLSSGLVNLTSVVGSTLEVSQSLGILSTGDNLNFTVEVEGAAWLRARRTSGVTPDNIIFTADPTGLAVGTYFGTIRLRSTSNTAVVELPARLRINPEPGTAPQPEIRPAGLFFSRIVGQPIPEQRAVQVGSAGQSFSTTLTLSVPVPWLQIASTSDPTGTKVIAVIRNVNMLPGLYETEIVVSSPNNLFSSFRIPVSYRVQLAPMGRPAISSAGIVHAASFEEGIAGNTWISIFGTDLAKSTRTWTSADFAGVNLPLSLDGVEVTVGGVKAAIAYVSPGQLNILAPAATSLGRKEIVVTVDGVASESAIGYYSEVLPAFFTFGPMSGKYAAALHLDSAPVGPADLFASGTPARPAKPGEVIQVFGSGFGLTNPPADPTKLLTTSATLVDFLGLQIRIGGQNATVGFAGLSGTGLNQFNVTVPALAAGDHEIVATIGSVTTRTGVFIRVQP